MTTAPDRRRGFTLVELLVTLLLIAILAALTTGAVFRVLAGEKNRATEATLSKIETGRNRMWSGTLDDASDDIRKRRLPSATLDTLRLAAGNDPDRVEVIWAYAKLKNQFPTTIAEAQTAVVIPTVPPVTLPARTVFNQLGPLPIPLLPTNAEDAALESAACLYVSLTAASVRGEVMSLDGLNQQVADVTLRNGRPARVFIDSWGKPIAFFRTAFPPEVQGPPYTRAGTNPDPCDPLGKLVLFSPTWTPAQLNVFWAAMNLNQFGVQPAGNLIPSPYPAPPTAQVRNWVATTVSAGPDGEWGNFFDGDNLVGYRTRRQGARGD